MEVVRGQNHYSLHKLWHLTQHLTQRQLKVLISSVEYFCFLRHFTWPDIFMRPDHGLINRLDYEPDTLTIVEAVEGNLMSRV